MSKPRLTRRDFMRSAAMFSAVLLPGAGRVQARPFSLNDPEDYAGRLCYNENPLGPSPLALQALRDEAALAHRYPNWLNTNVEEAIADHLDLNTDQVCVGAGATEIIQKVADAFIGPGDELITAFPSYVQMANEAIANGGTAVYVPCDENHIIDLQGILNAITENTKIISLVNPNNPLATIIHKDDMAVFLDQIPEGIIVSVDEAYHEYVQTQDYESCVPYVDQGYPVVVIRTFSKVYGLAGARVGYALSSAELIQQIQDVQLYATVSRPSHAAALAGLTDSDHVTSTIAENLVSKVTLEVGFSFLGLDYIDSETNFIMVDVNTEAGPVAEGLADLGFQVRTGWDMPQHIRVSTGTADEMSDFLVALETVLETSGVQSDMVPTVPGINSVYPNPFNNKCQIRITVPTNEKVSLVLYDILGRKTYTLINKPLAPGVHDFIWEGKNALGQPVASGVYMLNLIQGEYAASRSIQLLK